MTLLFTQRYLSSVLQLIYRSSTHCQHEFRGTLTVLSHIIQPDISRLIALAVTLYLKLDCDRHLLPLICGIPFKLHYLTSVRRDKCLPVFIAAIGIQTIPIGCVSIREYLLFLYIIYPLIRKIGCPASPIPVTHMDNVSMTAKSLQNLFSLNFSHRLIFSANARIPPTIAPPTCA